MVEVGLVKMVRDLEEKVAKLESGATTIAGEMLRQADVIKEMGKQILALQSATDEIAKKAYEDRRAMDDSKT
jgi:hypothetical protein